MLGSDQKTKSTKEMEDRAALSVLSIPKIEGLDIYTFFVDVYPDHMLTEETGEVFDLHEISTVPEKKDVKALLLFCDEPYCPHEIGYKFLDHYPNCVMAGGYVDNLIAPKFTCMYVILFINAVTRNLHVPRILYLDYIFG